MEGTFLDNLNNEFWKALDQLVQTSEIIIDRPKGSVHPKYPDFLYPVDYGYLQNTSSMDGEGIDLWSGTGGSQVNAILCIVDLLKRDSEIKLLLGCTGTEIESIRKVLHRPPFLNALLIRR